MPKFEIGIIRTVFERRTIEAPDAKTALSRVVGNYGYPVESREEVRPVYTKEESDGGKEKG